ncbi:hypothetical protein CRENPOLYSF2_3100005 [Crenothrix polyspora]|uniref:Uncharacterized protein n=1 Tax=Crenothrix polyspora TaxID=360316 RepID=A0A1R4HA78_9GAMM|nr:hypothetical protein CRENPOLYSF2_3100005 [Crenothrix polyspora]
MQIKKSKIYCVARNTECIHVLRVVFYRNILLLIVYLIFVDGVKFLTAKSQ